MKTSSVSALLFTLLALTAGMPPAHADDLKARNEQLVSHPEAFPPLDLSVDERGAPKIQMLTFNQTVVPGMEKRFSGFRFRVDRAAAAAAQGVADKTKMDLCWFFVQPEGMDSWYIVPMKGEMAGFENFLYFDETAFRNGLALLPVKKKNIIVQRLAADALVEGEEYLIWFACKDTAAVPTTISLAVGYRQDEPGSGGGQDETGILRFLGLVPAGQPVEPGSAIH